MKKKLNFYEIFWIFMIGSVFGWVIEGIYTYITRNLILNHSAFVLGPFDVAYGLCACFLTILLHHYKDSGYHKLFLIGFFGGSILEYIMSWGMELVVGFSAWNYSNYFLNINGRVCLKMAIFWGILSIAWIKIIYPFLEKSIDKINKTFGRIAMYVLISFLIFDAGLSIAAVQRAKDFEKGIAPINNFEVFLDNTFDIEYLKNMFNNRWGS